MLQSSGRDLDNLLRNENWLLSYQHVLTGLLGPLLPASWQDRKGEGRLEENGQLLPGPCLVPRSAFQGPSQALYGGKLVQEQGACTEPGASSPSG